MSTVKFNLKPKVRFDKCLPNGQCVDNLGDLDRCYFNTVGLVVRKPHKHPFKDHVLQADVFSLFLIACFLYHYFKGCEWRPFRYVKSVPFEFRGETLEQFYDRLEECDFETDR